MTIRTDTKKYQQDAANLDASDWEDLVAALIPEQTRCAGQRLILPGRTCIHCGSETPGTDCQAPAPQVIQAKRDRWKEHKDFTL